MKKMAAMSFMLFILVLGACNGASTGDTSESEPSDDTDKREVLPGDSPPEVLIEVDGAEHGTKLGAYCWDDVDEDGTGTSECVDAGIATGRLSEGDAVKVDAGEEIKIALDYTRKPNEITLKQYHPSKEIDVSDDTFTVPDKKGIYYYDYSVWWNDEEDEHLSLGDATYSFAVKVK